MAEINREAEELARIMAQVNLEMNRYGQLTKETADKKKDLEFRAATGLHNITEATEKGASAVINLGKAMMGAASSMYQGKKGAAAFNDSVDSLTTAAKAAAAGLLLLGGPLGLLAAAVMGGIAALGAYTKAANEMSDKLYKGYQGLAETGAAASDGMTGLFENAKKLGLSMNDLDGFVQLIGENAKDLALFSGTVFEGRKQFADMGKSMEQYREGLMNAGMTQEQINAGAMGYLKLQSRVGLSQNKTTTELADGAKKYLLEMDALSKVTGESRKAMEDQMEAARSEERFAAKLQELRSQGPAGIAAAKELELTNIMLAKENKQLAQGFRDASTGMITTEAAQKAMLVTQNQVMVQADRMSNGLAKAGEAATIIGQTAGNTAKSMTGLAKAGAYFGADYAADLRSGLTDYNKALADAEKEQGKQGAAGGKAADAAVQAQTDLRLAQQKGNEATERFVFAGIVPATNAMTVLAKTTTAGVDSLNKLFGITPSKETPGAPRGPDLTKATAELDASTEKAKLANERAAAAEKDANLTRAEKDRIKKEARESEAAVMQDVFKQREAQLKEQNARRAARRAGTAAPAGGGAAPAAGGAAPAGGGAAPAGGGAAGGGTAPPLQSESGPGTRSMQPKPAGGPDGGHATQSGGGQAGPAKLARVSSASGKSTSVNAEFAPAFQGLLDYLGKVGYEITDLGGFVDRDVRGKPGVKSVHAHGAAIDINAGANPLSNQLITDMPPEISSIAASLGLGWGGNWKSRKDAMHFSAAQSEGGKLLKASDGGVFQGPSSGYNVELHGKEAVIPLKNGAVPVSVKLDLNNVMAEGGIGPTFGGINQYTGINQGPITTDLNAVKDIAAGMGAFDKATSTITNPDVWKEIINSGIAMNFELGVAQLGTAVIPGIGEEIAARIKEIQEQHNTDSSKALEQVGVEFRAAMAEALAEMLRTSGETVMPGMEHVAEGIRDMARTNDRQLEVMQKILATNY